MDALVETLLCQCGRPLRHRGVCRGSKRLPIGVAFESLAEVELHRIEARRGEILAELDRLSAEVRKIDLSIAPLRMYLEGTRRVAALPSPEKAELPNDLVPPQVSAAQLEVGVPTPASGTPPEEEDDEDDDRPVPRAIPPSFQPNRLGKTAPSAPAPRAPQGPVPQMTTAEFTTYWSDDRDRLLSYGWTNKVPLEQIRRDLNGQPGPQIEHTAMLGRRASMLRLPARMFA